MSAQEAVEYTSKLGRVDASSASAEARKYIGAEHATLVIVGNASKFLAALKAVRGGIEVIPIDALDLDRPALKRK